MTNPLPETFHCDRETLVKPSRRLSGGRTTRAALTLILIFAALTASSSASERFGEHERVSAYAFFTGKSSLSGALSGLGVTSFQGGEEMAASSLFENYRTLALEYSTQKDDRYFAFSLESSRLDQTETLRSSLLLSDTGNISINYFDLVLTGGVSLNPPRSSRWNFAAGLSLVAMLDILNANEDVLSAGADSISTSSSDAQDKHIGFGFGYGGEVGAERRISSRTYLLARLGMRRPFTGVTRGNTIFLRIGLRIYE